MRQPCQQPSHRAPETSDTDTHTEHRPCHTRTHTSTTETRHEEIKLLTSSFCCTPPLCHKSTWKSERASVRATKRAPRPPETHDTSLLMASPMALSCASNLRAHHAKGVVSGRFHQVCGATCVSALQCGLLCAITHSAASCVRNAFIRSLRMRIASMFAISASCLNWREVCSCREDTSSRSRDFAQ